MRKTLVASLFVASLTPLTPSGAQAAPLPPEVDALTRCGEKSGCPSSYDRLYPYLERFCGGTLTADELTDIEAMSSAGILTKDAMEALFNAFGAMYGYEFKMLKHLNQFFYAKDASKWLPANCVAAVKSRAAAKDMPFELTKQRDQIKRVYDEHHPKKLK